MNQTEMNRRGAETQRKTGERYREDVVEEDSKKADRSERKGRDGVMSCCVLFFVQLVFLLVVFSSVFLCVSVPLRSVFAFLLCGPLCVLCVLVVAFVLLEVKSRKKDRPKQKDATA
jgi:hypothetical protein